AVRGLAIVVMALDHVRDFFYANNLRYSPTDLDSATPAVFLTRWVTNFCAPAFVLLAGVGASLWAERGRSRRELSWFLLTRGLWLVVLELTVIRCLGWYFNFDYRDTPGQVIWAIGWSMVVLAGLVFLPRWAVAAVAVTLIAGHNQLDDVTPEAFGSLGWLWAILHSGDSLEVLPGKTFRPVYPLMPWIGVMAAGYACGHWMSPHYPHRGRFFLRVGVALTLAFLVLRGLNRYGDPEPWSVHHNALYTAFSFVNCTKYPPSLLFLLMTLGPTFLLLAWFEREGAAAPMPLVTLGRVPLFFYVVHLTVIHGLAVLLSLLHYSRADWLFVSPPWAPGSAEIYPEGYGYSLPVVYGLYVLVLLILWPACRWYAGLKRSHHDWWLSYL
ncbi:MAG TPA: heparan-alpha-glucosaminide N-acetyltransferase domain-containing protein, partial [Gemmataceae bacterium]|nr:heparan-alpha-glucosaminide N-acetyltransferase domain-containing protein [Gemmataceae bacterium]